MPITLRGLQEPSQPRIGEGPGKALNTEDPGKGPTPLAGLQEPCQPRILKEQEARYVPPVDAP